MFLRIGSWICCIWAPQAFVFNMMSINSSHDDYYIWFFFLTYDYYIRCILVASSIVVFIIYDENLAIVSTYNAKLEVYNERYRKIKGQQLNKLVLVAYIWHNLWSTSTNTNIGHDIDTDTLALIILWGNDITRVIIRVSVMSISNTDACPTPGHI